MQWTLPKENKGWKRLVESSNPLPWRQGNWGPKRLSIDISIIFKWISEVSHTQWISQFRVEYTPILIPSTILILLSLRTKLEIKIVEVTSQLRHGQVCEAGSYQLSRADQVHLSQLRVDWCHVSGFTSAMEGIFTPQKPPNTTKQGFFPLPAEPVVKHLSAHHWSQSRCENCEQMTSVSSPNLRTAL